MKVKCPTCKTEVVWRAESKYRPFCSERCRVIDLGGWADGSNAIPGKSMEEEMMSEQLDAAFSSTALNDPNFQ